MGIREKDEIEIDLRDIFRILKKRLKLIVFFTLIATLTSGIISFYVLTPIYEASTEILVNNSESNQGAIYNINDINTELKLIETYKVIMKSPRIIDLVIEKYDLSLAQEKLIGKININTVRNSKVMKITVSDPNQAEAARIANAIAKTFQQEIIKIMNVDNVQILTEAKAIQDPGPVKPNKHLNIAIAFIIGIMGAVGLAFILEYIDVTIKTEEDVENLLGYPVLGAIATIEDKKKGIKYA